MAKTPQAPAHEFFELFGRVEYALKRSGHLVGNFGYAQADWRSYAKELGSGFFEQVVSSGVADTLINDPPRKLMRDGLEWRRSKSAPFNNIEQLIIEGVCRVRNSFFHGEKFVPGRNGQWERDARLVREALAVLKLALAQHPPD